MLAPPRRRRRGAVLAEAAIVLPVFLTLVLGTIDLGVGVFRQATLSHAARQGARQAIVRGSEADKLGKWGPTATGPLDVTAASTNPLVAAVRPTLVNYPAGTTVAATWPDGGNAVGDRVRVTVSSTYTPIVTVFLGGATVELAATSTMTIAH